MDAKQLNEKCKKASKTLKSYGLISTAVLIDDLILALNDMAESLAQYKQHVNELEMKLDHSGEQIELFQSKEA